MLKEQKVINNIKMYFRDCYSYENSTSQPLWIKKILPKNITYNLGLMTWNDSETSKQML